jgi:ADP-ribose pyrophosphatase
MSLKPQQLLRTVIYENPWVNLYVDAVRFPDGRVIDEHHVLDFEKESVAVVVENTDHDILFIQSYRYVTDSLEWEIPAGWIDAGESVLEAAMREVREETGYELLNSQLMYSYYPMNGIANKRFHVVQGLAGELQGTFDRNEVKEVRWVPRHEAQEMIRQQQIQDGYALTALLLHFMKDVV